MSQERRELAHEQVVKNELERKKLALDHRRKAVEAQIETLRAELLAEHEELSQIVARDKLREKQLQSDREAMAASRRIAKPKQAWI